jgi:hypothetical protein
MNRYGQMASEQMRRNHPDAFRAIADPTTYFTVAGQQLKAAIANRRDELLGPRRPRETAAAYMIRRRAATIEAERMVLVEDNHHHLDQERPAELDPELNSYYRILGEQARIGNELNSEP